MPTTSTQTPVGTFCGKKPTAKKPAGTPNYCYKKGIAVGYYVGTENEKKKKRGLVKTSSQLQHNMLMDKIHKEGLSSLKKSLKINRLNKDEVRSIAVRLTGTQQGIPGYSSMTLPILRQELINRGFNP